MTSKLSRLRPSHQSFESTPGEATFSHGNVPGHAAGASVSMVQTPAPVAVLVCHGMGQQVRFETVGQLAASILNRAEAAGCTIDPSGVNLSYQDKAFLARAELKWTNPEGEKSEVHLYEAYWAPVTEGKVTYWETIQFLLQAAWRGFRCSRFFREGKFDRWMFGKMQKVTIYRLTQVALIAIAVVLLLEIGIIAFVTLRVAAGVKALSSTVWWPGMPTRFWTCGWLTSFLAFLRNNILQLLKPFIPRHSDLHHWPLTKAWWKAAIDTALWLALVAQAFFVRYFIVEYAGDVAAYISPFKDSKFDKIRTKIQNIGLNVAKAIYGFDDLSSVPNYERIVIAGHSLGSVLAYDTLNAVINLDLTLPNKGSRGVLRKTTHLITFGSPLDKTAFLFRNQSNHVADPLREQMAAGFQPLIQSYSPYRSRLKWINLWSKMDIVSGNLDYYDIVPGSDPLHVENKPDPAAWIPFAAHVQYWSGALLGRTLYDAVK